MKLFEKDKFGNDAYQYYLAGWLLSQNLVTKQEIRQATKEFNKLWENEIKYEYNLED